MNLKCTFSAGLRSTQKSVTRSSDAEGYFTSYEKVLNSNVDIVDLVLASSPPWKGRGPPKGFIVPTIDSGLHLSSGGQSSGSENHSHLKMGLSLPSSSPLKEKEDDGCSSRSPIKPSIELRSFRYKNFS